MTHTKPLKTLITELQALESANPGICCMVNDHEHGGDIPQVELSKFYINEYNHVMIVNENDKKNNQYMIDFHAKNTEEMWESFGNDKGMWKNFEEFNASHKTTKAFFEKEMNEMATAIPVVLIHI